MSIAQNPKRRKRKVSKAQTYNHHGEGGPRRRSHHPALWPAQGGGKRQRPRICLGVGRELDHLGESFCDPLIAITPFTAHRSTALAS